MMSTNKKNDKCPLFCGIEVDACLQAGVDRAGTQRAGAAEWLVFASVGRVGGRGKHWQTVERQEDERAVAKEVNVTNGWLVGWQVVVVVAAWAGALSGE